MAAKKKTTKRKSTGTKRKVSGIKHVYHAAPKRRTTRRKKVSGLGALSENTEYILGAVAGAFVTRLIEKNMPAPKTTTASDYRPYAGLVLGAAATIFGKKKVWLEAMGVGAIVEGSRSLITDAMVPQVIKYDATGNTANKVNGRLPYTAGTNQVRLLNGNKKNKNRFNSMNGNRQPAILAKAPNALASVYDGM